jgi:cell division protein FtsW
MGEQAFVINETPTVDPRSLARRRTRIRTDVPLILVTCTLVIFGLLMLFSASSDISLTVFGNATYIFRRQLLWLAIGGLAALFLTYFDYHKFRRLLLPMLITLWISLVAVLIIKDVRFNAARTILGGSVQPSELAKLVIIIYLCFWLYIRQDKLNDINVGLIPMGLLLGFTGGLIWLQPDLSAGATILILGVLLFILAGGDWRQILLITIVGGLVGLVMVKVIHTGEARINSYIDGLKDPIQASYQVRRSLEAVVRGGLFGVGIGQGTVKLTGLPVPHMDSIYAIIVEETGMLGATFVMGLYGLFLWRGLAIAKRSQDQLGSLLAGGMTIWIVMEAVINMAVIIGLFPVTGNVLPLISYGGSNMVTTFAGIGIILSVARNSTIRQIEKGDSLGAVVDLRRRDRRRRVSRPRRSERVARES